MRVWRLLLDQRRSPAAAEAPRTVLAERVSRHREGTYGSASQGGGNHGMISGPKSKWDNAGRRGPRLACPARGASRFTFVVLILLVLVFVVTVVALKALRAKQEVYVESVLNFTGAWAMRVRADGGLPEGKYSVLVESQVSRETAADSPGDVRAPSSSPRASLSAFPCDVAKQRATLEARPVHTVPLLLFESRPGRQPALLEVLIVWDHTSFPPRFGAQLKRYWRSGEMASGWNWVVVEDVYRPKSRYPRQWEGGGPQVGLRWEADELELAEVQIWQDERTALHRVVLTRVSDDRDSTGKK